MRTQKTKEQFIQRMEQQIQNLTELLNFYNNVYLPTLQKFDGKVYNKRFINALKEQITNKLMFVKDRERDEIIIGIRFTEYNYNDYNSMFCKLLVNNEFRVDYNATINDKIGQKWIENLSTEIEQIKLIISNYDEYITVTQKLQEHINNYSNLPYQFRENIVLDKIWYLK